MKWRNPILFFLLSTTPALAAPTITITSNPSTITILQQFNLEASMSALEASSSYYLKVRIGPSESELNKGHTFNSLNTAPDNWLSDTDGWSKFPTIISDSNGNWNGSLTGRTGGSTPVGQNLLVVRTRKTDSSTNYDSAAKQVTVDPAPIPTPTTAPTSAPTPIPPTFTPKPPPPTLTPKPSSTPKPPATPSAKPAPTKIPVPVTVTLTTPAVLGEAAEFFSNSSPTPIPIPGEPTTNSFPWPAFVLIGLGLSGLVLSIFLFFRSRH